MTTPGECHESDECNLVLPNCKGRAICDNGICMCVENKSSSKQECQTNTDCESHCLPPCDIPYCDIKNAVCKCFC